MSELPKNIALAGQANDAQESGKTTGRRLEILIEQEFCSIEVEGSWRPPPSRCPECGADLSPGSHRSHEHQDCGPNHCLEE
jgi:hypothetical protein